MAFNLGNLAGLGGLTQSSALLARQQQETERLKLEKTLQALALQRDQQQQLGAGLSAKAIRDYDPGQIPQPPMAPLGGGPDQLLGSGGGMPQPQQLGGGLASSLPAPGAVKGSWFGNSPGWQDPSDSGLQASGVPVAGHPGIALPSRAGLGKPFDVTTPDGRTFTLPQTDVGPAKWTGRGVDINAAAAEQMGYTDKTFPTDKQFIVKAHNQLDNEVGQKGIKLIQQGAPVPAIQAATGLAKQAGREINPQQWGMTGLHQMMAAIDKADPDAPDAVKMVALGQLNKLIAPEERLQVQMYMKEHAQDLQVGLAEFRAQEAEKGRAAADQRAFGLEAMREGAAAARQQTGIDAAAQRQQAGFENKAATASRGAFPPDVIDMLSDQALSGDTSWKTNLGRGAQGAENIAAVNARIAEKAKAQGLSQSDLATRNAEYQGLKAGERTLSQRTANIGMRINEAQRFAPIALDASDKVDRTQFPLFNKMLEAGMMGTGDENIVRLAVATQSLLNAYAAAVTPTGTPTEGAQSRAHELLDKAWSQGQFKTAINQLLVEMDAASKSPGTVREEFRKGAAAPGKGGEPVTGPTSGGISASPYSSATGVWEAYQAGKLPREQAMKILEDQFGVKAQ